MNIKCPHCGTEYEVEKKDMFRYTKCQVCGKGFVVGAETCLQKDESKNVPAAVSPNGKELSRKPSPPRSPLVAIKRSAAVNMESSTVEADSESASVHHPPVRRPSFAPRQREESKPSSAPAASANVASSGSRTSPVVWWVIASMGFVVMALAMCAAFFIYMQGRESSVVQERLANSIKELNRKVALVEAETGKAIDAIAKEQEERLTTLRESAEQTKTSVERDLDDLEDRITSSEGYVKESQEAIRSLTAEFKKLATRVEELGERIDGIAIKPPPREMPQKVSPAQEKPEKPVVNQEDDSIAERKGKYNENLGEIKRLRESNPACVINPDKRTIRNTEVRFAKGIARYATRKQITYVRDLFYCGACRKETRMNAGPCCDVSGMKGYNEWNKAREAVDETAKIVSRIDELYRENTALKKGDN